jgi:hypothetical protein
MNYSSTLVCLLTMRLETLGGAAGIVSTDEE